MTNRLRLARRAVRVLRELAGASVWDPAPPARLCRAAAVAWHPDEPGDGHKVFQLLREAYRVTKLLASSPHRR
ncbi:hypothetical protein [Streptomyces viridosporus]|uniref:hypothetical protein n=1 Tax=Streptomyces viridosporus TaxID=67581 RepID=UPI0036F9B4D2